MKKDELYEWADEAIVLIKPTSVIVYKGTNGTFVVPTGQSKKPIRFREPILEVKNAN